MSLIGKKDLTEKQEKLLKTNIFIGKMLSVGVIFHLILWVYPDTTELQAYYAEFIKSLMNSIGYDFQAKSVYILPGYEITQDCLGWKSIMAYTALILSSADKLNRNKKYIFAGVIFLLLANILRIVTTIHLTEIGIISFQVIHGILWKWSLTALVLTLWIFWLRNLKD